MICMHPGAALDLLEILEQLVLLRVVTTGHTCVLDETKLCLTVQEPGLSQYDQELLRQELCHSGIPGEVQEDELAFLDGACEKCLPIRFFRRDYDLDSFTA